MFRSLLIVLVLVFAVHGVTLAGGVFLVNDPANLQLVDLRESYEAVNQRLEYRRDLLTPVRNMAIRRSFAGWGITRPSKGDLALGAVARVEANGQLAWAVVLRGELKGPKVIERLDEKYHRHWKRNGREAQSHEHSVGAWTGRLMPYMERDGALVALGKGNTVFLASTPGSSETLVKELVAALDGGAPHADRAPSQVEIAYRGGMTPSEKERIARFMKRTLEGRLKTMRTGFSKLYAAIGGDEVDDEDFKTTNEKINELFLEMNGFDVKLRFDRGPEGAGAYALEYRIAMPDEGKAQRLKELVLERMVFYRQNNPEQSIEAALDGVRIDRDGATLVVEGEIEGRERQADFAAAYAAMLLSYAEADKFMGLRPW